MRRSIDEEDDWNEAIIYGVHVKLGDHWNEAPLFETF